jgi:hypothetical protein
LEKKSSGFKVAVGAQLPVNDAEWPAAILGELYKQAPYVENLYQTEIRFDEKEPERGYAYGRILVYSRTNLPQSAAFGPKGKASGVQYIQIPFIVRDFKVAPLDLIMLENGEFRPQNRKRLRDGLFKPGVAEGTDIARWNTLINIDRYPMGMGGLPLDSLNTQILPYDKFGSAKTGELLVDLAPLDASIMLKIAAALDDPWCLDCLKSEGYAEVRSYLTKVADLSTDDGRRDAVALHIPPTVIQITRLPGAVYHVKRANAEAFEPVEEDLDRQQATDTLGPDAVKAVDETGLVTVSTSPVVRTDLVEEKVEPIKDFGLYRVKTPDGQQLLGVVFPKIVDLDGTTLPTSVFSNGSQNGIQKQIAGVRAGAVTDLPTVRAPKGPGVFFRQSGAEVLALMPLVVENVSEDPEGTRTYDATTMAGMKVRLHATPGAVGVAEAGENEYMMPGDMKFMPLPNEGHVALVEAPEDFVKLGHARRSSLKIVYHGDDRYTLDGCGLDKLGARAHRYIAPEDALFLMSTVGFHPEFAVAKLARARETGVVTVPKLRSITTLSEKLAYARKNLADHGYEKWASRLPKPQFLVKEALLLNDPASLDNILGLGFINPHNISVFISYIPELERTLGKVCQILFTARLGEPDGSELEAAAERAMHGLESTISGLELVGLEMQGGDDSGS